MRLITGALLVTFASTSTDVLSSYTTRYFGAAVWAMAVLSRAVARFGRAVDESERKLDEIRTRMDALSGKEPPDKDDA